MVFIEHHSTYPSTGNATNLKIHYFELLDTVQEDKTENDQLRKKLRKGNDQIRWSPNISQAKGVSKCRFVQTKYVLL